MAPKAQAAVKGSKINRGKSEIDEKKEDEPLPTHHVLKLPLQANIRERKIIEKRVRCTMQLANAVTSDLVGRVTAMRRDPAYREALAMAAPKKRSEALKALRNKHKLPSDGRDASEVSLGHWRSTSKKHRRRWVESGKEGNPMGWMTDVISSRVALAVGPQVWVGVKEWSYGKRSKPHFKSTKKANRVVWNSDNISGMVFDPRAGIFAWQHPHDPLYSKGVGAKPPRQ